MHQALCQSSGSFSIAHLYTRWSCLCHDALRVQQCVCKPSLWPQDAARPLPVPRRRSATIWGSVVEISTYVRMPRLHEHGPSLLRAFARMIPYKVTDQLPRCPMCTQWCAGGADGRFVCRKRNHRAKICYSEHTHTSQSARRQFRLYDNQLFCPLMYYHNPPAFCPMSFQPNSAHSLQPIWLIQGKQEVL